MAYLEVVSNYLPYMAASDKRGFISQYYKGDAHTGVDSVGNLWDMPVCAIFDGKVLNSGTTSSTGNEVTYQSVNGRVKVTYLHLRDKVTVSGNVTKNQVIGYEGSTGSLATGKHLHVTMYIDNVRVDPLPYLKGTKALPLEVVEKKTIDEIAKEVIQGKWGSGQARKTALENAGYDYNAVQAKVNELLAESSKPPVIEKTVDELAKEVLAGKWGSGQDRKNKLTEAGYDYDAVQKRVNEMLSESSNKKTIDEIAKEVIQGKWGSGQDRKNKLTAAGYDYNAVQKRVNELL